MQLDNPTKKHLRGIGHGLKPLVTVASKGLTDAVCSEINRALDDHELIKVSIRTNDRAELRRIAAEMSGRCGAELVQLIGHVALLFRAADKPDPRLSTVLRAQSQRI